MTHTFKRAVLFAAVVSMGAASAVSMPKVSMPKFVGKAKDAVSAKAQQVNDFVCSRNGTYLLSALTALKFGQGFLGTDASSVSAKTVRGISVSAPVAKVGAKSKGGLVALAPFTVDSSAMEMPRRTKKAVLYKADDVDLGSNNAGDERTAAVPGTWGSLGLDFGVDFSSKSAGFLSVAKGLHSAAIYVGWSMKAANVVRKIQAKRAAAKAAKPAQA